MYAHRSNPVCRSATVVVVEDITKPFERGNRERAGPFLKPSARDDDRGHAGRRGAGGVGVYAVADIQDVSGIELPSRTRGQKTTRAWLECADLRIAAAQDERKVVSDAESFELPGGRVVGQDTHFDSPRFEEV